MSEMSHSPSPTNLHIISYNCLGLKYISKFRQERLAEIGRRIAIANPIPEIVGLQECWTQEDYRNIRRQTRDILPYGKFYHSGCFGGGLAILSKWPIVESTMVRYPLNGRPTAFFRGDWYVGKGVACARIRMGPRASDIAEVFCTHLHAPYEGEPNDSYLCHRTAQAWEIAKLMRGAAERGHLVIGVGDFNMIPLSFAHKLITAHAPVIDAWRMLHPDSSIGAAIDTVEKERGRDIPTVNYNMTENGATCDSVMNTWRWSKKQRKKFMEGEAITVEDHTLDPGAKRLDYVFIGNGIGPASSDEAKWHVESARVGMTERHPSLDCSLSDHFSVEVELSRPAVDAAFAVHDNSIIASGSTPLPISTYDKILGMIDSYTQRERLQRQLRLGHFVVSAVISIGCFIGTWWSPRAFVSFLLLFISTLNFGAGVIDGLIGGLFMSSEIRALKEFEWEITRARTEAQDHEVRDEAEKEANSHSQDRHENVPTESASKNQTNKAASPAGRL